MSRLETLQKAQQLVELVLSDLANLKIALEQWPQTFPEDFNLLEGTEWQIVYIENDADIRSQEPEYEKKQLEYLRLLRDRIKDRIKLVEKQEHNSSFNQS